jgi:CheY-like chemotaxis protein
VNIAEQSIDQFSVAFAVWRITDQTIVYANQHALDAFGATANFIGKTTLWDIIGPLDTNLILAESIRSSPHGGPDIHLPDEAFATFKRQDNGQLFSGWYRARDIEDSDGVTRHRAGLIFTNYDVNLDEYHYQEFVDAKAQVVERELAAKVAHDINNALAILETEIESISQVHGVGLKDSLSHSLHRLRNIGKDMQRLASISRSLLSVNSPDLHNKLIPDETNSMQQPVGMKRIMVITKKEALLKAASFKPHAALVDLRLKDEDGTDVAFALREMFPDITIVYMTGYSSLLPVIAGKTNDVVLKKPFEISSAIAALTKDKSHDHIS